jgi:hypothetical protein
MDPRTFDQMIQRLSQMRSRRSLVGSSLGAALLGVVGLGDAGLAKKSVRTERCLAVGERCPKTIKHGQKKIKHTCEKRCCTRFSVVSADGKRRCACRQGGQPCTASTARQCCSGECQGTQCAPVTTVVTGQPAPPTCTDRIWNGTETDTDCGGGTCPRCRYFQRCTSRDDCEGAYCSNGTCAECGGPNSLSCGPGCFCTPPATGGLRVCVNGNPIAETDDTCTCPPGSICVLRGAQVYCYARCGT